MRLGGFVASELNTLLWVMDMRKYDMATKEKVLTIARGATIREASEQTGVPEGTIKKWRYLERERNEGNGTAGNGTETQKKDPEEIARAEAVTQALAEAKEYIEDAQKARANRMLIGVDKAVEKIDEILSLGKEDWNSDTAIFLRSVVGVVSQFVEKAQLLTGKPTSHQKESGQVNNRYEYDITQRIIADPEAVELANSLLRRAANSDASTHGMGHNRRQMDSV